MISSILWFVFWLIVSLIPFLLLATGAFIFAREVDKLPRIRPRPKPSPKAKPKPKSRIPIIRVANPKGETYWCIMLSERGSNERWIEKEEYCGDLESAKSTALIYKKSIGDFYRRIRVVEKEIDDQFDDELTESADT